MIRSCRNIISLQNRSKFFHSLSRKTIYDSALPRMLFYELYYVLVYVLCLGSYFIIQIGTIERAFEIGGICYTEIPFISVLNLSVAVAVRAIIGARPILSIISRKLRYSGLKSCPHSDMQCASSMA